MSGTKQIPVRCPFFGGPRNREGLRRHRGCSACEGTGWVTKTIHVEGERDGVG